MAHASLHGKHKKRKWKTRGFVKRRSASRPGLLSAAVIMLGLFVLIFSAGCDQPGDYSKAKAYRVRSRSQLIGGPKALGTKGDIILENDKIRVLLNAHATSVAAGKFGGAILDADINRFENAFEPAIGGKDQISELMPIFDIKSFGLATTPGTGPVVKVAADAVDILDDGSDGGTASVLFSGVLKDFLQPLTLIPFPLNGLPVRAETTYTLKTGDSFIEIETSFTVLEKDGSEPAKTFKVGMRPIEKDDDPVTALITNDAVGDAVFFGNSLETFGPDVFGFSSEFYAQDQYYLGRSIFSDPILVDWVGGIGKGVGYALVGAEGPLQFPLMESILTVCFEMISQNGTSMPDPGAVYTYKRYLVVAEGDAAGLLDEVVDLKKRRSGRLEGRVIREGDAKAASGAKVLVFKHPRMTADGSLLPVKRTYDEMNEFLASLPADATTAHRLIPINRFTADGLRFDKESDGNFSGKLPVNEETGDEHYFAMALGPNHTIGELVPFHVKTGETSQVALILPATGKMNITVRNFDQGGPNLPAKITIIDTEQKVKPDPFLGEGFLAADEAMIIHTIDGKTVAELPPGTYRVVASCGPEYSIDEANVTVNALETKEVRLFLDRVVDTSGWIAGDFHLHSERSVDSGLSVDNRILALLVEGIETAASTDHDIITNYFPSVQKLGAQNFLQTMNGEEVSHISYGHFNGYPLRYDQEQVGGGAVNWRLPSPTAKMPDGTPMPEYTPQDIFDGIRALGDHGVIQRDPIVVVNHSQESITGYLRSFGFTQYLADFETPDFFTVGDPVVHNGQLFSTDASFNFSWDFDAIELINGKRLPDIRTATEEETEQAEAGAPSDLSSLFLNFLVRTGEEQVRIESGDLLLDHSNRGMVDDYFTILAMGKRVGGLGNSDSHDNKKTEAGKARNYVMSSTDDPAFIDLDEIVENEKAGRVIASTGPFLEAWVNGSPIGSDIHSDTAEIGVRIRAQAPPWMSFDRIEIYGNGMLIGEIGRDASGVPLDCDTVGLTVEGRDKVVRFDETVTCRVYRDAFINVVGIGYEGMTPVINPTDGPAIELTDTLLLGVIDLIDRWIGIDLSSLLSSLSEGVVTHYTLYPYAVTNAIWVDRDGVDSDGDGYPYDGPGYIPGWFDEDDVPQKSAREPFDKPENLALLYAAKTRAESMTLSGMTEPQPSDEEKYDDDKPERGFACGASW